jgi:hypothetical protein
MHVCCFGSQQKLSKIHQISLEINECQVDEDSFKYLGIVMHKNMTWFEHIRDLYDVGRQRDDDGYSYNEIYNI